MDERCGHDFVLLVQSFLTELQVFLLLYKYMHVNLAFWFDHFDGVTAVLGLELRN